MGFVRRGCALLFACVCLTAVLASQASAWSQKNAGSPGRVEVLKIWGYQADATELPKCVFCDDADDYLGTHQEQAPFVAVAPERWIWRAPYTGMQRVTVQYRIWHMNVCSDYSVTLGNCTPGFKFYKQDVGTYTIGAAYQRTLMPVWVDIVPANLSANPSSYAMFGMDAIFTWRTIGGAFLGRTNLDWNGRGDYACLTRLCSVDYSPKYGAFLTIHD